MPSRPRSALLSLALVVLVAIGVIIFAATRPDAPASTAAHGGVIARTAGASTVTVENAPVAQPIPPGFVGLTTEYRGLEAYAGTNPSALDPVFEQLVRNLAPKQSPILRIGGDSTDWTWWPVPHMVTPGGVRYSLNATFLQVASALAKNLNARLLLGINFEADSGRVAAAESQALIRGLGRGRIDALELGNEPELYAAFPWYKLPDGQHVRGRPPTYDYGAFIRDFSNISRSVPREVTLAGPSMGSSMWIPLLGQFLAGNRRVGLATLHRYPLKHCSPRTQVTIPEILSSTSSTGLAASVAGAVRSAHARGVALRVDEMSAISCGGVAGVSDSFATALWSLDALFAMARVGVDGVNVQTAPGSFNELFSVAEAKGAWQASVRPAYYGLMMFAEAAPPGSRFLRLSGAAGAGVNVWATRAPSGDVHVVLINDSTTSTRTVTVRASSPGGPSTLERLQAPSAHASSGVTLGGQSFGSETATGLLAGPANLSFVKPGSGGYVVTLPAASAALLTLYAKQSGAP
ncbi:MAG TPA: glycosyl hydrolase family 79 C-terminal domain-containing protein [Solirubrobacteraceae bacterium]